MNHSFVAGIIEIHKEFFPVVWKGRGVYGIAMVLRSDVTFATRQIERGNVMSSIAILELEGTRAGGQSKQLMTHTDSHNRNL